MNRTPIKGRGAIGNPNGRFAERETVIQAAPATDARPATSYTAMRARSIVSHNQSPDIPFDRSINPYLGCEHGCIYCYARPSHSYLDLSPGLDFETRIFYKPNAVDLLRGEWSKPGYVAKPITIGANTDPYQPAEKRLRITRRLLEVFRDHRHPVSIITKGSLLQRDLDLFAELAERRLVSVAVSVPTLNADLKRVMEPRVPAASARFEAIRELRRINVPVTVMLAPLIPAINDNEIESILKRAAESGADAAAWILLRLPHELKDVFRDWLNSHFPDRAERVLSLLRQASGGRDYDNRFGRRQTGSGAYAKLLMQRFRVASAKHGLATGEQRQDLDCHHFIPPSGAQLTLDW